MWQDKNTSNVAEHEPTHASYSSGNIPYYLH